MWKRRSRNPLSQDAATESQLHGFARMVYRAIDRYADADPDPRIRTELELSMGKVLTPELSAALSKHQARTYSPIPGVEIPAWDESALRTDLDVQAALRVQASSSCPAIDLHRELTDPTPKLIAKPKKRRQTKEQEAKDKMRAEYFAKAANKGQSASSDGGQDNTAVPNPFVGLTPRRHKSDTANARPSTPANPRSTPTPSIKPTYRDLTPTEVQEIEEKAQRALVEAEALDGNPFSGVLAANRVRASEENRLTGKPLPPPDPSSSAFEENLAQLKDEQDRVGVRTMTQDEFHEVRSARKEVKRKAEKKAKSTDTAAADDAAPKPKYTPTGSRTPIIDGDEVVMPSGKRFPADDPAVQLLLTALEKNERAAAQDEALAKLKEQAGVAQERTVRADRQAYPKSGRRIPKGSPLPFGGKLITDPETYERLKEAARRNRQLGLR